MKRLLTVAAFALALIAVPALAEEVGSQPVAQAPVAQAPVALDLAVAAEPMRACPVPDPQGAGSDTPLFRAYCEITVDCDDGSTRSCSDSTSPATCQGVDANCPSEQGWVQCNGAAKVFCPACPPSCPDPNCPAGNYCTSSSQCGPCGVCYNRKCLCIAEG